MDNLEGKIPEPNFGKDGVTATGDPTGVKTLGSSVAGNKEIGQLHPPEEEKGMVGAPDAAGGQIENKAMKAPSGDPDIYDK